MHNGYISDQGVDKIDKSQLNKPTKRGNAPTFIDDGTSVELHHKGQNPEGPFEEIHWEKHRGKGNDLTNHPDKGLENKIDRREFKKQKSEYWREQYDNWPE